jgi:2-dehydro-3-deoxyphosphogluconate aldolase/(4S)-4-hydroxy-2-oxoglutarate aldolase
MTTRKYLVMSQDTLSRILESGIVAVVRAEKGEQLLSVAEALLAGGVEAIEVTFTVPAAHRVIERVAEQLGDRILLGAGTVLDAETARIAILAGAQYVVAPNLNREVIGVCRRYSKPVMPGALTPTEIIAAWEAGADVVKIFPSELTGPAYLKAIHGPLPQIRLMPTGGVNLETATAFLQAGACALGVGSALVDTKLIAAGKFSEIEQRAKQFVAVVRQFRKSSKE